MEGASDIRDPLMTPDILEGAEPPKSFHTARKIFYFIASAIPLVFLVLFLSQKLKKCCPCNSWSFADKLDLFNRLKVSKLLDGKCTPARIDQFLGCVIDTIVNNIPSYQEFKQKQGIIALPLAGIDDQGFANCANASCR